MEINYKLRNGIFLSICVLLIFNNIPKIIAPNFLGGEVLGDKLVFYPMFIGMIYTIYYQYNIGVYFQTVGRFLGIYIIVVFVSMLLGLYNYPYYNIILQGPSNQIEKLPFIISFFSNIKIHINEQWLIGVWIVARAIKNLLIECIWTFGGAYMIFCWYYQDWQVAFQYIKKAVVCSISLLLVYCFIEVPALANQDWATHILVTINPFLHTIKNNGAWWPPLLWTGQQLRSVFAEPSYFGIYAAFAMPWLWEYSFNETCTRRTVLLYVIITAFSFCLFLTKARTALALFCGECVLLCLAVAWLRYKKYFYRLLILAGCIGIAFGGAIIFLSVNNQSNNNNNNNTGQNDVQAYMSDNLGSLASENKRSNQARYTTMKTNLRIGLDHPLLGVGTSLRNAYFSDYLPEDGRYNDEIQIWLIKQRELGILKFPIPGLSEYTKRFAETGIIGLLAYLLVPLVLLRKLLLIIVKNRNDYDTVSPYVFYTISLVGILTSGIGDSITITYCYWVLLGLGYAMCYGKRNGEA